MRKVPMGDQAGVRAKGPWSASTADSVTSPPILADRLTDRTANFLPIAKYNTGVQVMSIGWRDSPDQRGKNVGFTAYSAPGRQWFATAQTTGIGRTKNGEGGIRTRGPHRLTRFQDELLKPLGHLSAVRLV